MRPNPIVLPDGRLADVVNYQRDVNILRCIPTANNPQGILDLVPGKCYATCTTLESKETVVVESNLLRDVSKDPT
jgi:hypothetical protein